MSGTVQLNLDHVSFYVLVLSRPESLPVLHATRSREPCFQSLKCYWRVVSMLRSQGRLTSMKFRDLSPSMQVDEGCVKTQFTSQSYSEAAERRPGKLLTDGFMWGT